MQQGACAISGEMLAIRYEGRVQAGQGASAYEKYRLLADRDSSAVAWVDADAALRDDPSIVEHEASPAAAATSTAPGWEACGFLNRNHALGCPLDDDQPPF